MGFFRKNKKNEIKITALSPTAQIRKIIYDSGCKDPELVAEMLGLTGISDEVAEMEEDASSERIAKIAAILPIIEMHSQISAKISAVSYFASSAEVNEDVPGEDVLEAMIQLFKYVSFSSAVSCVAALIDLNLISGGYLNE